MLRWRALLASSLAGVKIYEVALSMHKSRWVILFFVFWLFVFIVVVSVLMAGVSTHTPSQGLQVYPGIPDLFFCWPPGVPGLQHHVFRCEGVRASWLCQASHFRRS